jgi:hypothetical protein
MLKYDIITTVPSYYSASASTAYACEDQFPTPKYIQFSLFDVLPVHLQVQILLTSPQAVTYSHTDSKLYMKGKNNTKSINRCFQFPAEV